MLEPYSLSKPRHRKLLCQKPRFSAFSGGWGHSPRLAPLPSPLRTIHRGPWYQSREQFLSAFSTGGSSFVLCSGVRWLPIGWQEYQDHSKNHSNRSNSLPLQNQTALQWNCLHEATGSDYPDQWQPADYWEESTKYNVFLREWRC